MLDITHLMNELAHDRLVFHSEADFQHALAWRIHDAMPDCGVRLEYSPFQPNGGTSTSGFPASELRWN